MATLNPQPVRSYVVAVDQNHQFNLPNVSFGTYSVSYQRSDYTSGPLGIFRFPDSLVVDREQVTWRGAARLVPAVIDVTVNGRPMPDDSMLDGEGRGVLILQEAARAKSVSAPSTRLSLGETGPAHFERPMLEGHYQIAVSAQTLLGRTYLRGLNQDVLETSTTSSSPFSYVCLCCSRSFACTRSTTETPPTPDIGCAHRA